jgi:hypothetical protein
MAGSARGCCCGEWCHFVEVIEVRVGIVRLAGVLESLKDRRVTSEGVQTPFGKRCCPDGRGRQER